MNDEEYVANIPNLSNKDLIAGLISCGHDNYYNVMYYPIIEEIKKRLSKEWKKGKCTKINCPIQMNHVPNDCDIKTCPYRTERKIGKWKDVSLFTRECSECGTQFIRHGYDNFCPNCGAEMTRGE